MSGGRSPRQLHLGLLAGGDFGVTGWRRADSRAEELTSLRLYVEMAQLAERGRFDAVFRADGVHLLEADIAQGPTAKLEPITLLSALAVATRHIGLVATLSTSFSEPYNAARQLATLDLISGGRAGWNIVTSKGGEANYGHLPFPEQAERYEKAAEFVEVVQALWRSWEPDAIKVDRARGRFADPARIHRIDHAGRWFNVRGPLNVPPSPQGQPVLAQAGASERGREFGARYGELIFVAATELADAQAFAEDMRRRAAGHGRDPASLRILPGVKAVIGATETEAWRLYEELLEPPDPVHARADLERALGDVDLSGLTLDQRIPAQRLHGQIDALHYRQSRPRLFRRLALEEGLTLGQLIRYQYAAKGHWIMVGTPEQVAARLAEWFQAGAADGFNLMPSHLPGGVADFVEQVVPLLQRRGVFRREYEGATLREHLGLPIGGGPDPDR